MTIQASQFTPEVLLEAPRRSAGIPNPAGTLALFSVSTYSFAKHERTSEIRVLDFSKNECKLVTDAKGAGNQNWLCGDLVLLTAPLEGATEVYVGDVNDFEKTKYKAGTIDGAVENVKVCRIGSDKYQLAFSALTRPDGSLANSEKSKKSSSSGRLYNSTFVRHWDYWLTSERNSLWTAVLSKADASTEYSLADLSHPLKDSRLECPIPPFGGSEDFDLSEDKIAFVTKASDLAPAFNTKQDVYVAGLKSGQDIFKVEVPGFQGAASNPVFSPDGTKLAFLCMRQNGYESDKRQIFIYDVEKKSTPTRLYPGGDDIGSWDRSPGSLAWSVDGKSLFVVAEDEGEGRLFEISTHVTNDTPKPYTEGFNINDVKVLAEGNGIFLSTNTLVDNSRYYIFKDAELRLLSSMSLSGAKLGLSSSQISQIHFPGNKSGVTLQAWVVKPLHFSETSSYPLAFLVHGGPQGAWENGWSTRWNPAVFAEQGYVVVCPNPTGSTGFGQELTDAIQMNWGGDPYHDLVNCFDWIEKNMPYVDIDRAVGLGASYGGYMMNWIQGNKLGRRFKALVTHDGIFSMQAQMGTEEVYFPMREFGGLLWEQRAEWLKWDPAMLSQNWATPHLIIHSEKDYRLAVSEGLAAFNVLQAKQVESEFLMFPDENHWVLNPENSLLWHTVVLDFINKKIGLPTYSSQSKYAAELRAQAYSS